MELILVRHAKAFDRDLAAWPDDSRRPLTAEGRRRFARFARRLGKLCGPVDLLESSGFVRAWQTAQLLHEHAGFPKPSRFDRLEGAAVDATEGDPLDALCRTLDGLRAFERVVWVGHEPDLSRLASRLLSGDSDRVALPFKKGAAMAIGLSWSDGGARSAQLCWMLSPGDARRLRG